MHEKENETNEPEVRSEDGAEKLPEETAPADVAPADTAPDEALPEDAVPEETASAENAPADAVAEDAVSEETVPVDAAPVDGESEETASAENAAADAAPEDTVPEETAPDGGERGPRRGVPALVKALLFPFLFWWAAILVCELVIHTFAFETMGRFPTVVLFSAAAALLAAGLTTFPTWGGRILSWLVPPFLYLIYGVQLVYHYVFDAFVSLVYVSQGKNAITQFWDIVVDALYHCLPRLLIMAVPMAAFYILRHLGVLAKKGGGVRAPLILLACGAAFSALAVASLPLGGTGISSAYTAFHSASATVDRWIDHFGVLTAEVLDLKRTVAGDEAGTGNGGLDLTAGGGAARNILPELDFGALDSQTGRQELQALNRYFGSRAGTAKNQYTGMFKGYNLIEICAESFSPYVIDPEITPTLYRLSHEGFVFENFYNSFPSVTSDGEYSFCMGNMINLKRVSFAASMDNYLPYCMGNMFAGDGVRSMAYHNNYATMYNRINTHPNMGYDFKAINFGLDMKKGNPASDLEMFEKTVDDYIHEDRFHAYYMSYSGHAPYNFDINQMCIQNKDLTVGIDASEGVRAYYCGELELERALTYLLERLEEEGVADRTVIVLSGDHYPYGLKKEYFAELAGSAVEEDPFWRYRNSFICWNGGMEEPVVVDDYCCTQDILPTLLNLFGFPYDSRMLTGRDVLADCTHAALLKNGSVLTKQFLYNGNSGELRWQTEEQNEEGAKAVIEAMEDLFTVAADLLDQDYYQFAYTAAGLSEGRTERPRFNSYADTAGTYYEDTAEYFARYGVIVATNTGGNLRGEDPLPRSQLFVITSRWLGLSGDPENLPYTDATAKWYRKQLAGIWEAGILPEGQTEIHPDDLTTPEYAVEFMTAVAEYVHRPDAHAWAEARVKEAMEKQAASGNALGNTGLTRGTLAYIMGDLMQYTEEHMTDSVVFGVVIEEGDTSGSLVLGEE